MDYFLQDKSRLEGQPKRTIANYVAQNGILVPKRFDSIKDARNSNKDIFLRSEHPQEYDGISGLLDSFDLNSKYSPVLGAQDIDEVKQKFFEKEDEEHKNPYYRFYCQTFGKDIEEFKKETSFSIWEKIEGTNRTVIADSAIAGRYHIMTYGKHKTGRIHNYAIIEDKKLLIEYIYPLPKDLKKGLLKLVETYEDVRHLDKFDPNHCPIMEFQTHKNKHYFLQYHRTRDFSPTQFMLDRELKDREIEVPFIRGATTKEGRDFKVTVYYHGDGHFDPEGEDGSFDLHYMHLFSESQFKKRKLQILHRQTVEEELDDMVCSHDLRSKLFKPEISAIIPIASLLKDGETTGALYTETKKGHNSYIMLYLVSDGRRAIAKRLD